MTTPATKRRGHRLQLARVAVPLAGLSALSFTVLVLLGLLFDSMHLLLLAVMVMVLLVGAGIAISYRRLAQIAISTREISQQSSSYLRSAGLEPDSLAMFPQFGALGWFQEHSPLSTTQILQRLTRMRSIQGRDLLSLKATRGRWNWSSLERALESYRLGGNARLYVEQHLLAAAGLPLAQLADLCFRQNVSPLDQLNAGTMYQLVLRARGTDLFEGSSRAGFLLEALAATGRYSEAERLLSLFEPEDNRQHDVTLFRANFRNPFRRPEMGFDEWLETINAVYRAEGLAELRLVPGEGEPILRLATTDVPAVENGPLVSILMPVFKPDAYAELAVRSALGQTYQNIEIIIVDDGSGEEYKHQLARWAALDPRITVVHNRVNSGAYTSRNMAFQRARGEFVTVFDGDDWQHPQKIERLVAAAAEQSDHRLVSAPWARVSPQVYFHYRGWRGAFITPAHVSTMFPTAVIREKLGYWDTVRKAADGEFILRYKLIVNPEDALEISEAPLTLSLVTDSNLSVEDFRLGFRVPDRSAYREYYGRWHQQIEAGKHNGYLPFPLLERAFAAPGKYLPVPVRSREIDVLFVGDFSSGGEESSLLLGHVEAARGLGLTVGVQHKYSLGRDASFGPAFTDRFLEAFRSGELQRVEITDVVAVKLVLIYDPTGFQFHSALLSNVGAEQVAILIQHAPESDTGHHYEVTAVAENVHKAFGRHPVWLPLTSAVFTRVQPLVPEAMLAAQGWNELRSTLVNGGDEWPSIDRIVRFAGLREAHPEGINAGE
ncbi:glycosyltransferase family 2 protein [Arthrobacter sulfonylureivorans]|uniref:Glycosyltransferase n=1 Tax=Arthrobacter sulfonylureivorans TaxID=2486855 RepID=A0ABY3WI45_9MICC|nr:glycosyltransferase family A protein [Arthrobacter sulfonylureivorans]UNK47344.1 glycosyltransferase [Arthrobacter sulfonylureivorans]